MCHHPVFKYLDVTDTQCVTNDYPFSSHYQALGTKLCTCNRSVLGLSLTLYHINRNYVW